MQAAQHAALRARDVVLHERAGQSPCSAKRARIPAFVEEAALVAEHRGSITTQPGSSCR
jgi:hypothetical protein